MVKVNEGVAMIRQETLKGKRGDERVKPRAATGSHPPEMKGAATLKTCSGVRTISNAFGILDPPIGVLV